MLTATAISIWGLVVLLRGELNRERTAQIAGKIVASLGFFAVGIMSAHDLFGIVMVVGLACGVAGDIALLHPKGFFKGLVAFLIGHACYVVAFAIASPLASWPSLLAAIPVAAALAAWRWLRPQLGPMKKPVLAYIATITLMVIGALAVWRTHGIEHASRMLVGTLLFFASDLAVARERFVTRSSWNRLVGLPIYYAGQLLIAWSL